jgi:hypothetical protein
MRFVYPTVTTNGFGNNVITLAKAFLISQSCRMTYLPPLWPPTVHVPGSKNGYGYYFPSTLTDRGRLRAFESLFRVSRKLGVRLWPPMVLFDRTDYEQTQVEDAGDACLAYLKTLGLEDATRPVVVTTGGMWGGYGAIRRARSWIEQLLLSHPQTRKCLANIEESLGTRLRIGVHLRMGDFLSPSAAQADRQGERVVRLPLNWVSRVCREIRKICNCEILLVTDGTREELLPFLEEFDPIHLIGQPFSALLGLLLLSRSHLVVCSNSTYSRVACFLNDRPYIWFADTLVRDSSGRHGYLWKANGTPLPAWFKPTAKSNDTSPDAVRRCFGLGNEFHTMPKGLKRYLESNGTLAIESPNDLLYGQPVSLIA